MLKFLADFVLLFTLSAYVVVMARKEDLVIIDYVVLAWFILFYVLPYRKEG